MGPPLTTPLFLLVLSICSSTSSYADLTTFVYKGCANQKFQDPSGISSQNLKSLYANLISQSSTTNFYNTTTGNAQLTTSITGVYQCQGDLSNSDCNTCVKKIPETIEKVCGGDTIAARVQLDGCYMRYEVVGFPPASATELLYKQCASNRASGSGFDERLESALEQIEKGIGNGKGYYAAEYQSISVLGQCESDLGNADCVNCVKTAAENGRSACGSSLSGRIYLQQCYIGYTYYPNGVPGSGTGGGGGIDTGVMETGGGGGRHNTQKTVAIVIGGLAGLFLGIAFLLVLKSAFKKKKDKYSHGYGVSGQNSWAFIEEHGELRKQGAPQSMYPRVIVKEQLQDHVESLEGLRYLVRFGVENVAPDECYAKARQNCVSNLAMRTPPIAKGSGKIENREIKEVDHVVQRPRAVLSSPDNDYLIGKMNEKAFKRVSTPKPHASGKVNLVHVDVENARVRVRGTNPTFGVQNRPKIKDHNRPSILKDKTCITKLKS